ncbi:MAG: heavy metal-binding domain-containing protein [Ekhidna sp.]|nr:heavy metal-binding domain-containing protein [Ekhidna sp.]
MLLTTTNNVEGRTISTYYGLITGEAIIGANIFKDIFASITDIVGGRSGSYEKSLKDAKNIAVQEMIDAAAALGANAIIAIDLDYETLGKDSGMMMVSASGTAVKLD